jgi:subtilisin family serine protease
MNKTNKTGWVSIGNVPVNQDWVLYNVGDFNQDDNCDLLWQNSTSGLVGVWLMNGASQSGWAVVGSVPDLNWHIDGLGDFNMDGQTDLLWRNYGNGDNGIWLMNGTTQIGWVPLARVADTDWVAKVSTPTFYNPTYGHGLVNAAAAVAKAIGQPTFADVSDANNTISNNMLNVSEVWAQGYKGQGVVVAVVDTGVDINHPALKDNIWVNTREIPNNGIDDDRNGYIDDVNGWDFATNDNNPTDEGGGGHGTHVAGTIAAKDLGYGVKGIAPNARIMPVRVEIGGGQTPSQYNDALISGIKYAINNGANIINLSRGIDPNSTRIAYDLSVLKTVIGNAASKDIIVVCAAGNFGSSLPEFPARYAIDYGIAVGWVDNTKKIAYLSNRSGSDSKMQYVVAPGTRIKSTIPLYYVTTAADAYSDYFEGTSMAAAHISGIVALMLSAKMNLKHSQIRAILTDTSTKLV